MRNAVATFTNETYDEEPSPAGAVTAGSVVPDSATGELRGLLGEGRISVAGDGTHALTLEYELDE